MATLRNKRKLAAVTRETQDEHPRNGQSRNTSVPRINEEYITQLSKKIEGRVSKKLSQEFSRTESRILGALSKLDEFLLNQRIRMHSGTVPEALRNTNVDNQGTNEDDSMSDPHPETGLFRSQTTQNFGQEVGPYMVTGVIEETHDGPYMVTGVIEETHDGPYMVTGFIEETHDGPYMVTGATECHDMVTGVTEEVRNGRDMVTAVQEDIPYCSSGNSRGKQKKARSTSQPQFRSENSPATIEADQILSAFSNWRRTVIEPISTTISQKSRNCLSPSRQQCPQSTGNQRNLNCLKIYSKRV